MKLYVHYEGPAAAAGTDGGVASGADQQHALTLKLTLPKKWRGEPVQQVLELFLESYNAKKKPAVPLEAAAVHMAKAGGKVVQPTDIVEDVLSAHDDLYVVPGPAPRPRRPTARSSAAASSASSASTSSEANGDKQGLRCRNYGCNKTFIEAENSDTACSFHTAPPVFHDTKKGWSCCSKRVYDWDEFNLIEGCAVGRHSVVDPKQLFAPSPTVSAAARAEASGTPGAPLVRSIEEFNKANPDAASAAKSAAASISQAPACTRQADGTATCVNKGCQKKFVAAENHSTACCYHKAPPVFHDAGKFWACCPDQVKYDFDAFLKIPGCMVGCHCDGSPESQKQLEAQAKPRQA